MRDRQRTKMERDILADLDHAFIVQLHYGQSLSLGGLLVVCCILFSLTGLLCGDVQVTLVYCQCMAVCCFCCNFDCLTINCQS